MSYAYITGTIWHCLKKEREMQYKVTNTNVKDVQEGWRIPSVDEETEHLNEMAQQGWTLVKVIFIGSNIIKYYWTCANQNSLKGKL